jgi:hypothetical protein
MKGYLSTAELAARLRVAPNSVARWAEQGLLPVAHRSDAGLVFRLVDVLAATASWSIRPPHKGHDNHKPRQVGA